MNKQLHAILQEFREAIKKAEEHGEYTQLYDIKMSLAFSKCKDKILELFGGKVITRCKDCEYAHSWKNPETNEIEKYCHAHYGMMFTVKDGEFCSWAVKRDG